MAIETNTKIGIISRALILNGEKPAQSLTDDRSGVTTAANLFEMIYENELQSNRWRFAVKKEALTRLANVPLNQWTYAYQLPADMLLPLHVYPPGPYEIYARHLYTDSVAVEMDYQFKPEISQLPAYFTLLLTCALARDMAPNLTEDDNMSLLLQKRYVAQRDRAMFADAQGRPSVPIAHSPFTDVR